MGYVLGRPGEGEFAGQIVLSASTDRISWSAVFAGFACTMALQILFTMLGIGLGFAISGDAFDAGGQTAETGATWYWVITGVMALFAGGSVAGRMAGIPLLPSTVLHGVIVWSIAVVLSIGITVSVATGLVSGTIGAVVTSGDRAIAAASDLLPDDPSALLPDDLPPALREAQQRLDETSEDIRREAREIVNRVVSTTERERAQEILTETARDVLTTPGDAASDLSRAVDRLIGDEGVIGDDDREALIGELEQRFSLSQDEATQIIDRWSASLANAGEEAREAYAAAIQQSAEAAKTAVEIARSTAFWGAFALFLGLIAACAGAAVGRPEDLLVREVIAQHDTA